MTKHYIRSDGNGGVNISKALFVLIPLITLLIGVITATISITAFSQGMRTELTDFKEDYSKHVEKQDVTFKEHANIVSSNTKDIVSLNVKIDRMQDDITELKIDVKEIKKNT